MFGLSTGAVIPVLVKAQTVGGTAPSTAEQPFTPICTCVSDLSSSSPLFKHYFVLRDRFQDQLPLRLS